MNTMTNLPIWPKAYPDTQACALLKSHNSDFKVTELPLCLPSGEGEHVWLYIEKNGANTAWVAQKLAALAKVKEQDVGFAGLKDRHAITKQWFSVYLPKGATPDFRGLNDAEITVLEQSRHSKKLRRGDLLGNRFEILLRDVQGERNAIDANLQKIAEQGVPNYFGAQRFGHDGGNIESGRAMLAREVRVNSAIKKSLYLSAVRSFIFNEVLAQRIRLGLLGQQVAGDVLVDGEVTGPLWGRGRSSAQERAQELEQEVVQQHVALCDGLEHAGLQQERRALVARPEQFHWQWFEGENVQLMLTFSLPSGYYATSLINEILQASEPSEPA
ncbi:MAG: hypothetical protein RL217_1294 [Pseudomonadota bacterium]|jgi:tRNA pseudouridine13 synthase